MFRSYSGDDQPRRGGPRDGDPVLAAVLGRPAAALRTCRGRPARPGCRFGSDAAASPPVGLANGPSPSRTCSGGRRNERRRGWGAVWRRSRGGRRRDPGPGVAVTAIEGTPPETRWPTTERSMLRWGSSAPSSPQAAGPITPCLPLRTSPDGSMRPFGQLPTQSKKRATQRRHWSWPLRAPSFTRWRRHWRSRFELAPPLLRFSTGLAAM